MSFVDKEDDKLSTERIATSEKWDAITKKDNQAVEAMSSTIGIDDANAKTNPLLVDNYARTNDVATLIVKTDNTSSKTSTRGLVLLKTMPNETKPGSKTTKTAATGVPSSSGVKTDATSRNTNDRKMDLNSIYSKMETSEESATKSKVGAPAVMIIPKQSHQNSHSKPQMQHQRYFVSSRQNQEEAVSKMVQNIFKLLETSKYSLLFQPSNEM